MRQVWKPLEWAEMPRMACMPTGRPIILSWRRPVQSVQGMSSTISSLKAACASSAAMRRMLSAATPVSFSTFSGAYSAARKRSASSWNTGTALRPSASAKVPDSDGCSGAVSASTSLPEALSCASGLPSASRANRPSSAAPGSRITSHGTLV